MIFNQLSPIPEATKTTRRTRRTRRQAIGSKTLQHMICRRVRRVRRVDL